MLLLLLLGAGTPTPSVDGVRAHGSTTYRSATDSATVATSISLVDGSTRAVTNADTTED